MPVTPASGPSRLESLGIRSQGDMNKSEAKSFIIRSLLARPKLAKAGPGVDSVKPPESLRPP